jgi:hypothetical protein
VLVEKEKELARAYIETKKKRKRKAINYSA